MRRALGALGVSLALVAALTLLSIVADALSHALYTGGNGALHNECGIFTLGLSALIIAQSSAGRHADAGPPPESRGARKNEKPTGTPRKRIRAA